MSHNAQNHDTDEDLRKLMGPAAASAIGWKGPKPDKAAEAERIRLRDEALLESLLEIRGASEWMRDAAPAKPRRELFAGFWREGELAVLVGPPGIGRSILAVQIAESIARGQRVGTQAASLRVSDSPPILGGAAAVEGLPKQGPRSARPERRGGSPVVYFDFERSPEQFTERYTARAANGRKVKYRFSKHHQRTHPGIAAAHLQHYSREEMLLKAFAPKANAADIVIVEDLSHLTGVHATANDIREILRKFRRYTGGVNSALVIAELDCRSPHVSKGRDLAAQDSVNTGANLSTQFRQTPQLKAILAEADSLFALLPSTMSPDIRYLKLLKGSPLIDSGQLTMDDSSDHRSSIVHLPSSTPVPAYRLTRSISPPSLTLTADHRPPTTSAPFLGLQFLGMTLESEHTRDYAAEALKVQQTEERNARRKKLSARDAIALGVLDGSYQRYLLGD